MQARLAILALFVGASIMNLPLVHALLSREDTWPLVVFPAGLLTMGLAWAGACAIQRRRQGSVLILAWLGVAEAAIPLVPQARDALGLDALIWPLAAAAFSAASLVLIMRSSAPPRVPA